MRRDISSWKVAYSEDRGVNKKEWVEDPDRNEEALFKETQIKDTQESTYADYAEAMVSDICKLLGVPCAEVELVERNGKKGCISYSFCDRSLEELIEIGSAIQNTRLKFNSKRMYDPESKEFYGIEMILEGLESVSTSKTNFAKMRKDFLIDVLTDSLIDHYDRNPSNLSIIRRIDGVSLSPKYDNGTSLSISVPQNNLKEYIDTYKDEKSLHKAIRERILSKIGYLGCKYVKYEDLETFIFNYYYDDVKDFVSIINEKLTDKNIDKILSQEKYDNLSYIHKQIIGGKLRTNRDAMLERYNTISKKQIIDKIVYNKAASSNFLSHVQKGTIPEILPEYNHCVGIEDTDTDYDLTLDMQIPEKIQAIVDITQLSRYFGVPINDLTKREKNLLKWVTIIENIQKGCHNKDVFDKITDRLGFLKEDKELMCSLIKDKFKDENDIFEAREIIYGENGIGAKNINLYLAKKFVDAAVMKREIREERFDSLQVFSKTMKEVVELETIVMEKLPAKKKLSQLIGIDDKNKILAIQYEIAKAYRENPKMNKSDIMKMANELSATELREKKEEVMPGVFVDKKITDDIRKHTYTLPNGKRIAIYDRPVKVSKIATSKLGVDYFAQICDHFSGDGVTISIITKKGVEFPEKVKEYAEQIIQNYGNEFPPKAIVYMFPKDTKKMVSRFAVSSVDGSNSRIPNVTASEMTKKVMDLFSEQEKSITHNDE